MTIANAADLLKTMRPQRAERAARAKTSTLRRGFVGLMVCLTVAAAGCGSSSRVSGDANGSNFAGAGPRVGDTGGLGGPQGPVGGGNGSPVGFGPGGSPTGSPTPPPVNPDDIAAVMYATDGTDIKSLSIAPDGTLAVLQQDLEPEGNISKLVLGPNVDRLYAADYFGDRLYSYNLDIANGSLSQIGSGLVAGDYPSDLKLLGNDYAYATNANAAGFFGTNDITSFVVNPDGQLAPNTASPTLNTGSTPSAIAISPNGEKLYVTNVEGASISQYNIGSGGALSVDTPPAIPTVGRPRFTQVTRDGRFLFVSLYSGDGATTGLINTYAFDPQGDITLVNSAVWDGTVPQNMVEHPSLPILYVSGDDKVQAYSIESSGVLTPLGAALPVTDVTTLAFDPTGRFLYASGNFASGFTYFSADPSTGALTPLGTLDAGGHASFVIVPGPDA